MSDETKPRNLAIALDYEQGTRTAPRITAKGHGLVADRIVELARDHGVVVETNPVLAQALSGIALDDTIPIELYEAVAVVIGYVLRTNRRS